MFLRVDFDFFYYFIVERLWVKQQHTAPQNIHLAPKMAISYPCQLQFTHSSIFHPERGGMIPRKIIKEIACDHQESDL
jgi:hypothetical protein